ncbi:MAG: NAD(P)/FAD-dependent oxidoreductase [Spirochaetota bacterium]
MQRVAVVGAGISGLTASRELARQGFDVVVFERGRGVGGRISRRREAGFAFDHGAQYFTARSQPFVTELARWVSEGVAAAWEPRMATATNGTLTAKTSRTRRYVGTPGMSALAHDLSSGLDVRTKQRITAIVRHKGAPRISWELHVESQGHTHREGPFDSVILACTPQQGLGLLEEHPEFSRRAGEVAFDPTWAVMLGFNEAIGIDLDAVFVDHPALSWAARNSSKPGRDLRSPQEAWVLHASSDWSRTRDEMDPQRVTDELISAFDSSTGVAFGTPEVATAHRWRYARPARALGLGALWDGRLQLGMCGDWCSSPRVEGAYESGRAAAAWVTGAHGRDSTGQDSTARDST